MKKSFFTVVYQILAVLIIAFAVFLSTLRALTPLLADYREELSLWASQAADVPIRVGQVEAKWYGFEPTVSFKSVIIYDKSSNLPVMVVKQLSIGVDVLRSLWERRIIPGTLFVAGIELTLEQLPDGRIIAKGIGGLPLNEAEQPSFDIDTFIHWLLARQHIVLNDIQLFWHGLHGEKIPIKHLAMMMRQDGVQTKLLGQATIGTQKPASTLNFVINLADHTQAFDRLSGEYYFSGQNISGTWLQALRYENVHIDNGLLTFELWGNMHQGQWHKLFTRFSARALNITDQKSPQKNILFNTLDGAIDWRFMPEGGTLIFENENVRFEAKHLFRKPIWLETLSGQVDWKKWPVGGDGWQIQAKNILLNNPDIKISGDFDLKIPNKQAQIAVKSASPNLKLLFNLERFDLARTRDYLPTGVMHPALVKWLDSAIVSGKMDSGVVLINGDTVDFPFDQQPGDFITKFLYHDAVLQYAPDWPPLRHLTGELLLNKRRIDWAAQHAEIFGASVNHLKAHIPVFHKKVDSVLYLSGEVTDNLSTGLNFLQNSPLKKIIGYDFKNMHLTGDMELMLNLVIPVEDMKAPVVTNGDIRVKTGHLSIPDWKVDVTALDGTVRFTERDVTAQNIQGKFLHYPIQLDVGTIHEGQEPVTTQIKIRGDFTSGLFGDVLKTYLPSSKIKLPTWIEGTTSYVLELLFHQPTDPHPNQWRIQSNLAGIMVNMPPPFQKPKMRLMNVELSGNFFDQKNPLLLKGSYGNLANILFHYQYQQGSKEFIFKTGNIRFGKGLAVLPKREGLFVDGWVSKFVFSDWQEWLAAQSKNDVSSTEWLDNISQLDLDFVQFEIAQQAIPQAEIKLHKQADHWILGVKSSPIEGQVILPFDQQKAILGRFKRLYWVPAKTSITALNKLQPNDIPSLDIYSDDFRFGQKQLGQLSLETVRQPKKMHIRKLGLVTKNFNVLLQGDWENARTVLSGNFDVHDAAGTLQNWAFPPIVEGQKGKIAFNLGWQGAPFNPDMKTLLGHFTLQTGKGVIKEMGDDKDSAAKLGAARILTLLNITSLTRRFQLDFSDLTAKGFAFDILKGDFTIQNGIARTQNTYLDGALAYIGIKGDINLVTEMYDLSLVIQPYVTANLPVVATFAGGPLVGAITLFAERIFRPGIQQIVSYTYSMQGPWKDPVLQQVSKVKIETKK